MNKYLIHFRGLKASQWWWFCFSVFFCFSAQVTALRAQEGSGEGASPSAIGMRLPEAAPGWAHELDPRIFPFEETPNHGLSLRGEISPYLDWRPFSLKRRAEIDSTGKFFVVAEEINGLPLRPAYVVSIENIINLRLAYDERLAWHKAAAENIYRASADERRGPGGVNIEIPVAIKSRAFEQIFGGSTVGLNVQGDITIKGGFRNESRDQVQNAFTRGSNNTFKMNQTQRFTVTGRIGDKVTVNVDQDSERPFDFENNIRLNYTGYEDDILQKIEAGNVALSLPGTRFVTASGTNAGLFGIKTEMQLGNLAITAIASQEKGENKKLTLSGGATEGKRQIQAYEYYDNTYFFLDWAYRDQYRYYSSRWVHQYNPNRAIKRIQVYKSRAGTNQEYAKSIPGTAYRYVRLRSDNTIDSLDATEVHRGSFILVEPKDYEIVNTLGYIVMKNRVNDDEVLAVAYEDSTGRQFGDIGYTSTQRDSIRLKLIKPRSPIPSRDPKSTWQLVWKNIYYLGSRDNADDDFQPKIFFKPPSGDPQETLVDSNGVSRQYLQVFNLDVKGYSSNSPPDNVVDSDPEILRIVRDENSTREHIFLVFPDLRPFDPDSSFFVGGVREKSKLPSDKRVAAIYDTSSTSAKYDQNRFYIEIKSKNRSNQYSLGFNVIEGSEEVLLDGRKLARDQDYNIDYFSGNLVITNDEALKPGHTLEISYQGNQLFQLEKKTIIGTRAEYRLNANSFFGGTLLYLNQSTLDQRVRLGSVDGGPMRNLIWDFNTALRFQPNFLSRAVNALPMLSTQEPSDLRIEAEIAQILPNPNTIDSKIPKESRIPGDKDGVAFIDDFEASKRTTPLGINRRGWVQASIPDTVLNDPQNPDSLGATKVQRALARRGTLLWYNPYSGESTRAIYPNRRDDQIDAGNQTTQVLRLVFIPTPVEKAKVPDLSKAWGGIMRALSAGFYDQTESKFIEILFKGNKGRLHIDLGQISEDSIPNGKLDSEDTIGGRLPDNVLEEKEDIGLDGVKGDDRSANFSLDGNGRDFWDLNANGQRDWGEPASDDDWFYRYSNDRGDQYETAEGAVNGTERSQKDGTEGGSVVRPDTEDINASGNIERVDNYYTYTFDLDTTSADVEKYFQGGKKDGWKLYRIPLAEGQKPLGSNPSFSRIEYVRLWVDGFASKDSITIADISLVGNEWKEVGIGRLEGSVAGYNRQDPRLEVTVVNTDENLDYSPPEGIIGELDRVRNLRAKEQSQVLRIKQGLGKDSLATAQKTFLQPLSLINYNRVKMFVYGKGEPSNSNFPAGNIEFFIRFGSDTSNYYEFREQVFAEWDKRNVMDLNLIALASLKLNPVNLDSVPGTTVKDYFQLDPNVDPAVRQALGLQPTQTVRVRGNPSLTNVRTLIVGTKNLATQPFQGEIWMDELRVTEVKKDKGIAMRARVDLKLADFMNIGGEINQRDADFHPVAERFGRGDDQRSYSIGGNMAFDKLLPQSLGLSIPVSATYSYSLITPKFVPGTDIQAINNDRIRRTFIEDTIRSVAKNSSFNLSIKRRAHAQNFFVKNTIDNLSGTLNYTYSDATNSQTALSKRIGWSGDVSYNLTFGSKNFIQPFKWIGKAPLLRKLTNTKVYYSPQNLSAQLQASSSKDSSRSQILDPKSYKIDLGVLNATSSFTSTHNFRTGWKLLENFNIDFSRSFTNDLLHRKRIFNDSTGFEKPKTGLMALLTKDAELLGMSQSFGARYTPNLFAWFNPNFTYSSNYRYTNNLQQGRLGRGAGTSTNFTANGNLRFADIFQFLKRKDSPSGRETPSRTRQAPRLPPGEQQRPERQQEGEEEDQEPVEPQPEAQPERPPQDKKEKQEKKPEDEQKRRVISPVDILRVFGKFKDLNVNFTRTENFSHAALTSTPDGFEGLKYQLGFVPRPGIGTESGITIPPRNYQRGFNYSLRSGMDISRNFNLTLSFEHDERRNEATNKNGSVSNSWLGSKEMKIPVLPQYGIPFPEWTLTWSGLERIEPFNRFATSLSISHGFGGKKISTWQDSPENVTEENFSFNFRPLIKVNLSWKNGMISSFTYNKTTGDRPTYTPRNPNDPLQIEQDYRDRQRGSQITKSSDMSFVTTYAKQSGFRLPLPFLKNKELRNSVDLSITFQRRVNEAIQSLTNIFSQDGGQKTTSWSFSPRINYSFSNRVRGGAHFEYGKTVTKPNIKTSYREFGIDVNISIRGE